MVILKKKHTFQILSNQPHTVCYNGWQQQVFCGHMDRFKCSCVWLLPTVLLIERATTMLLCKEVFLSRKL